MKLENNSEYGPGFSASLIDGPSIDLIDAAGLDWTEGLNNAVWGKYNWLSLLAECESANVIELEEHEGGPGMSDTYYWVSIDDPISFQHELKTIIFSMIT